jgi:hypothetical protein
MILCSLSFCKKICDFHITMATTMFVADEILHVETIMSVKAIKKGDALLHACNSTVVIPRSIPEFILLCPRKSQILYINIDRHITAQIYTSRVTIQQQHHYNGLSILLGTTLTFNLGYKRKWTVFLVSKVEGQIKLETYSKLALCHQMRSHVIWFCPRVDLLVF